MEKERREKRERGERRLWEEMEKERGWEGKGRKQMERKKDMC